MLKETQDVECRLMTFLNIARETLECQQESRKCSRLHKGVNLYENCDADGTTELGYDSSDVLWFKEVALLSQSMNGKKADSWITVNTAVACRLPHRHPECEKYGVQGCNSRELAVACDSSGEFGRTGYREVCKSRSYQGCHKVYHWQNILLNRSSMLMVDMERCMADPTTIWH